MAAIHAWPRNGLPLKTGSRLHWASYPPFPSRVTHLVSRSGFVVAARMLIFSGTCVRSTGERVVGVMTIY